MCSSDLIPIANDHGQDAFFFPSTPHQLPATDPASVLEHYTAMVTVDDRFTNAACAMATTTAYIEPRCNSAPIPVIDMPETFTIYPGNAGAELAPEKRIALTGSSTTDLEECKEGGLCNQLSYEWTFVYCPSDLTGADCPDISNQYSADASFYPNEFRLNGQSAEGPYSVMLVVQDRKSVV